MPKTRVTAAILTTMIATVLLSCTGSAIAATGWVVNGTLLSGSAALATTSEVTENPKLTASGITIECAGKNLNWVSPQIESPSKNSADSLDFTACEVVGEEAGICTIGSTEIKTTPIVGETTLQGMLGALITIGPKTKTTLATIKYSGSSCALQGLEAVTGKFMLELPTGQDASVGIGFSIAAGALLHVASSAAALVGKGVLKLASHLLWDH